MISSKGAAVTDLAGFFGGSELGSPALRDLNKVF